MVAHHLSTDNFPATAPPLFYKELIEQTEAALYTTDNDGNLTYFNPAVANLWGYKPDLGEKNWCGVKAAEKRLGRPRLHVLSCPAPLYEGKDIVGTIVVLTDVTELKHKENLLKQYSRRKDDFLAMLGHELRNSLGALSGGLDVIGRGLGEQEKIFGVMRSSTDTMARLLDDLLDLSRVNDDMINLQKETVALDEVVERVVLAVRERCVKKEQALETSIQGKLYMRGDAVRLGQIFSNLLLNASKYTHKGGVVRLDVCCEGREIVARVSDNGQGIEEKAIEKIFDPFYQCSASRHLSSGLGIGLALAKRLTILHDGTITASSKGLGKGAVFELRFPLAERDETVAAPRTKDSRSEKARAPLGLSVVLIEDSPDIITTFTILLEGLGCKVYSAEKGGEGMALVDKYKPDAVIVDLGLPDMSGYELARKLRSRGVQSKLMAVSGFCHDKTHKESALSGFDYYFCKPVRLEKIESVLSQIKRPQGHS